MSNEVKPQPQYVEKRPRYFDGQYLKVDDFVSEQEYHIDRQRRISRFLHVSGILEGLQVTIENTSLRITPGAAIDNEGKQILLTNEVAYGNDTLKLSTKKQFEINISALNLTTTHNLSIAWNAVGSDQQSEGGSQENTRIYELPTIELKSASEALSSSSVLLAVLKRQGTNNSFEVDLTKCQYSGLRLPATNGQGVTLRSHNGASDRAILSGSLSITQSLSVMGNSTLTGNVGIGTTEPKAKLHVKGRVDITGLDGVNRFEGLHTEARRTQLVLSSEYSDLVIASSQVNHVHGSTLTFATYNPDKNNPKEYCKWVINQGNWGARKQFLEFGYSTEFRENPHENINDLDTVLTLDGVNKNVGIGTREPKDAKLVVSLASATADASLKLEHKGSNFIVRPFIAGSTSSVIENTSGALIINPGATNNVGIGTTEPKAKLHVKGRVDITGLDSVNRFEGLHTEERRTQLVLSSEYSDLVIASSKVNHLHGSTLTFATSDPIDPTQYRKWVINQGNWGARKQFLEFGYSTEFRKNPHENINDLDTVLTLDGVNKNVGIGTREPKAKLHVKGTVKTQLDVIECKGRSDWTVKTHPVQEYFRSRLTEEPPGTMMMAICNFPSWERIVWQGYVDWNQKIWVNHLNWEKANATKLDA